MATELATVKEELISTRAELRRKSLDFDQLEAENAALEERVEHLAFVEAENAQLKQELDLLNEFDYKNILKRKVRWSNICL